MNLPAYNDFINFHDHNPIVTDGRFFVDNIMVHENRRPVKEAGLNHSVGAHPWHIPDGNIGHQLAEVKKMAAHSNVFAIGETGFDKRKGPGLKLQEESFIRHFEIAEELQKPLVIHCVRAWPEIINMKKMLRPSTPWIIHGFKGKKELAQQLCDKDFFLSAWVEWAIRPVAADTLNSMPVDRLFLETDAFDIDIADVYRVVASFLNIEVDRLKDIIFENFMRLIPGKSGDGR